MGSMSFLASIPALVKVGIAFALIVGLNRFRLHLGVALFIGAALPVLSMGMGPIGISSAMTGSLLDPAMAALLLIVAVILVLSRLMADSGQLERIVTTCTRMTRSPRMSASW